MSPKKKKARSRWEDTFAELAAYKARTGTLNISSKHLSLTAWAKEQRYIFHKKELSREKQKKLESIGFDFSAQRSERNEMIQHLQEYKSQFGNLLVPKRYKIQSCGKTINLGEWVHHTRQKLRKGAMNDDLKRTLDSMGFVWVAGASPYTPGDMIQHLLEYKSQFGNLLVPRSYIIQSCGNPINLGEWVNNARQRCKRGDIKDELKQTLDSMGFVWKIRDRPFHSDDMIQHLQEYKSQFGNLLVPRSYKIQSCGNTINLGAWVHNARQNYKRGKMKDELKQSLDSIGFVWDAYDNSKNEMIHHLQQYKSQFGNLLVPSRYKIHSHSKTINLGTWVHNARQRHNKGEINEEIKQTLDSMGFVWNARTCAEQRRGQKRRISYELQNPGENESITDESTHNNSLCHTPTHSGEDLVGSASDDIDSPTSFHTPEPKKRRAFWRPPTPYPASDDEEIL